MLMLSSLALKALARVRRDEEGQSMIEYALLAFLIAIAAVVLLSVIGVDIMEVFDGVEDNLGTDATGPDSEGIDPRGEDDANTDGTAAGGTP